MKQDATSPDPDTARIVFLHGERFSREGLETAWLMLAENDGARFYAAKAMMHEQGWDLGQAIAFVDAAACWTGNVVKPEVPA